LRCKSQAMGPESYNCGLREKARKFNSKDAVMSSSGSGQRGPSYPLWVVIPALIAVLFLIVWVRVYWGSYQNYREGMVHLENQASIRAITYFDRSIHWYTPLNPWVRKSAERLWEIGEQAEQIEDTRLALIAYRTIRQGFYAARSVYQPGKDWIRRAEDRIDLLLREEAGRPVQPLESQLAKDPDVFWSLMVLLGLFGWVGSVFAFIMAQWGPWRERENLLSRRSLWVAGFLGFLALWFAGMWLA
jgi:hypothetical protein